METVLHGVIASLRDECVFALRNHDKGRLAEARRRLNAALYCLRNGTSASAALAAYGPKARRHPKGKGR